MSSITSQQTLCIPELVIAFLFLEFVKIACASAIGRTVIGFTACLTYVVCSISSCVSFGDTGPPAPHSPRTTEGKNRFRSKLPARKQLSPVEYISEGEGHEPSAAGSIEFLKAIG